jgi:hypothetical protein
MQKLFDEEKWSGVLKRPDWYMTLVPELKKITDGLKFESDKNKKRYKEEVYGFFQGHLENGTIALGNESGNWDTERAPIDTIIIHHTKNEANHLLSRLSAVELVRLYATYYFNPTEKDKMIKGKPISSGHIRDGQQVFWPYQWMLKKDGKLERLLRDDEVGWQAGNWEVNCRSIAIAIDENLENSKPTHTELATIANLIKEQYPNVAKDRIFGHSEINKTTTCPSKYFLPTILRRGWKKELLDLIE